MSVKPKSPSLRIWYQMRVVADERERSSSVPTLLEDMGVRVVYNVLETGDYLLSNKVAVERKTVPDLVASIFDGRLFKQVKVLRQVYEKPILLIEGDLTSVERLTNRPRAVIGALTAIAIGFEMPVLYAGDKRQTAEYIYTIASRLHRRGESRQPITPPKAGRVFDERIRVLITLPGVGPTLAERLLKRFRSLRNVFNASITELMKVKGLSRDKAETIYTFINSRYAEPEKAGRQTRLD